MPRKVALEALNPMQQSLHDAQFRALQEAREGQEKPPVNMHTDTLKSRRLAVGLRSTEVASLLQIAESSLRNYESGSHEPGLKPSLWQKLMTLYQVNTEELFQLIANTKAAREKDEAKSAD